MKTTMFKKFLTVAAVIAVSASVAHAAPAKKQKQAAKTQSAATEVYDPIEPFNRAVFAFNQAFDKYAFRPLAWGYRYITPRPIRNSLGNATNNLFEPINMLNAFLQGDFTQGVTSFWRFLINTTVGIGGLNDVATEAGLKARTEDFGQTLGFWGVGSGPYIVLPIIGPSNLRDGVGMVADTLSHPLYYYLDTSDALWTAGAVSLVRRERLLDPIDDINASSLDPYVTYRSIYAQRRAAQIKNRGSDIGMLDATAAK